MKYDVVISVPIRVVISSAVDAADAAAKAHSDIQAWLAQCPPGSTPPEYKPVMLSVEPKK